MNTETNPIAVMPIHERIRNYGSVSTDTLKSEHLLKAFVDTYFDLMPEEYRHQVRMDCFAHSALNLLNKLSYGAEWDDSDQDTAAELIDELINFLTGLCPDNFYFGAHPYNGADFGFWEFESEWS